MLFFFFGRGGVGGRSALFWEPVAVLGKRLVMGQSLPGCFHSLSFYPSVFSSGFFFYWSLCNGHVGAVPRSVIPGGAVLICAAQRAAGAASFHTGFERRPLRCEEQSQETSNSGFFSPFL